MTGAGKENDNTSVCKPVMLNVYSFLQAVELLELEEPPVVDELNYMRTAETSTMLNNPPEVPEHGNSLTMPPGLPCDRLPSSVNSDVNPLTSHEDLVLALKFWYRRAQRYKQLVQRLRSDSNVLAEKVAAMEKDFTSNNTPEGMAMMGVHGLDLRSAVRIRDMSSIAPTVHVHSTPRRDSHASEATTHNDSVVHLHPHHLYNSPAQVAVPQQSLADASMENFLPFHAVESEAVGGGEDSGKSPLVLRQRAREDSAASFQVHKPPTITNTLRETVDDAGMAMLNNYVLMDELGEGAVGVVHLAFSIERNELVAIKMVPRPKKSTGRSLGTIREAREASVRQEIALMTRLRHRSVVSLFEVIDAPGSDRMCLVMQYVDRGSLAHINPDGTCSRTFPMNELAEIARQLAAGLDYLHSHGVVHRDIKPENILINSDGNVFLSDFGASEEIGGTVQQFGVGTPMFMSPEMLRAREAAVHQPQPESAGEVPEVSAALLPACGTHSDPSGQKSYTTTEPAAMSLNDAASKMCGSVRLPASRAISTGTTNCDSPKDPSHNKIMIPSGPKHLPLHKLGSLATGSSGGAVHETHIPSPRGSSKTNDMAFRRGCAGDMWAFGVTLYALLVGRLPFEHLTDIRDHPGRMRPLPNEVSEKWRVLIKALLHPHQRRRPTAYEARALVRGILQDYETDSEEEVDPNAGEIGSVGSLEPRSPVSVSPHPPAAAEHVSTSAKFRHRSPVQ